MRLLQRLYEMMAVKHKAWHMVYAQYVWKLHMSPTVYQTCGKHCEHCNAIIHGLCSLCFDNLYWSFLVLVRLKSRSLWPNITDHNYFSLLVASIVHHHKQWALSRLCVGVVFLGVPWSWGIAGSKACTGFLENGFWPGDRSAAASQTRTKVCLAPTVLSKKSFGGCEAEWEWS